MNAPLVSILIPTRQRLALLEKALDSLHGKVADPRNLEVIIRVDQDDAETRQAIEKMAPGRWTLLVYGTRGRGRADMHLMIEEMARLARGRFLMPFRDDATMETSNWDVEVARHDSETPALYLDTQVTSSGSIVPHAMPIVHRSYRDSLGHMCASADVGRYLHEVLKPFFDRVYRRTRICINHASPNDGVSLESREVQHIIRAPWDSDAVEPFIKSDQTGVAKVLGV